MQYFNLGGGTGIRLVQVGSTPPFDPDAQAFITAASITDLTQQSAVNQLVLDLKTANIWTKMKAVYPFVGGTASTHKWNLKDPRDLDVAYRLSFSGGLTHSANGVVGGVNGYADTFVNPSSHLSLNNTLLSFYTGNGTYKFQCVEMGVNPAGGGQNALFIAPQYDGMNSSYRAVNSSQLGPGTSPTMDGFFVASRINSTNMKLYKNNSILFNDAQSSGALINGKIFILCYNEQGGAGPLFYSNKQCAFASIGDGLNDTEAASFTTAVQNYQTTLSRQV